MSARVRARALATATRRAPVQGSRALRRASAHGYRSMRRWARRPTGRLALPSMLIIGLVAAAVTAGGLVIPQAAGGQTTPTPAPSDSGTPPGNPAPSAPAAPPSAGPSTADGLPSDALRGWAEQISARTDIPAVALRAYGYGELVLTETRPDCGLRWTTLAAIGRVESHHGSINRASIGPDGRAEPEILGPPLDGEGDRKLIEDTDNGALDGDPVYDRAVGPMQFIPETWRSEQVDATGDGAADPHNIHDAALAAAHYLCSSGRDLNSADDWWAAVLAYNNVQSYAQEVFDAASDYGRRSRG